MFTRVFLGVGFFLAIPAVIIWQISFWVWWEILIFWYVLTFGSTIGLMYLGTKDEKILIL